MRLLLKYIEIAHAAGVPLSVTGRHGIGKTAVVEQLSEHGYHPEVLILSQQDPLTLGGMPRVVDADKEDKAFVTNGVKSISATPQYIINLRRAAAAGKKPILVLDEFNRADTYAFKAAMRLINEGQIAGHSLPTGTLVVLLMNPETATDNDMTPLNDPLLNRLCHVPVHSDVGAWSDWAKSQGAPASVLSFIAAEPKRLNGFSMEGLFEKQLGDRILPTERAVWNAIKCINAAIGKDWSAAKISSHEALFKMIKGLTGRTWATEYVTYLENTFAKPFTLDEMLNPTPAVLEAVKERSEQGHVQVLVQSLEAFNEHHAKANTNAKEFKNFWKFFLACPRDIQASFLMPEDISRKSYWNLVIGTSSKDSILGKDFPAKEVYSVLV